MFDMLPFYYLSHSTQPDGAPLRASAALRMPKACAPRFPVRL